MSAALSGYAAGRMKGAVNRASRFGDLGLRGHSRQGAILLTCMPLIHRARRCGRLAVTVPRARFSYIFISFFSAKKSKIGEKFLRPDGQNSQIVASTCGFVGRKWP